MLPKKIHQIWLSDGSGKVPNPITKEYTEKTRSLHPDFEYKLWDNKMVEDLLESSGLIMWKKLYERASPFICKCDIARYFILYMEGGIYMDLDVNMFKPLNDKDLQSDLLFFHENRKLPNDEIVMNNKKPILTYSVCNSIIGSTQGNPFWNYLATNIQIAFDRKGYASGIEDVMLTTGPRILTTSIQNYMKITGKIIKPYCYSKDVSKNPVFELDHAKGSNWKKDVFIYKQFPSLLTVIAAVIIVIIFILLIIWRHSILTY